MSSISQKLNSYFSSIIPNLQYYSFNKYSSSPDIAHKTKYFSKLINPKNNLVKYIQILLTTDNILIYNYEKPRIILSIPYQSIRGICLQSKYINIYLSSPWNSKYISPNNNFISLYIFKPFHLIKQISLQYNTYYMASKSMINDIKIKNDNFKYQYKTFPEWEVPYNYKICDIHHGYKCFVPSASTITDVLIYGKHLRWNNVKFSIIQHSLTATMATSLNIIAFHIVYNKFKSNWYQGVRSTVWAAKEQNKKMNLKNDYSIWKGYYIKLINSRNNDTKAEASFECSVHWFISRWNLEVFDWFEISMNYPIEGDSVHLNYSYNDEILETIGDSIYWDSTHNESDDLDIEIIAQLFNSLVLTRELYSFYSTVLNSAELVNDVTRKGVIYIIKLVTYLIVPDEQKDEIERIVKEKYQKLFHNYFDNISSSTAQNNSLTYYEDVKLYSFDNIIKLFEWDTSDENKWKIYNYLDYCLDGGWFPDWINYNLIINSGGFNDTTTINNNEILNQFASLLSISITSSTDTNPQIISIDCLINTSPETFTYNSHLLNMLLKSGVLLYWCDTHLIFSKFLFLLLRNKNKFNWYFLLKNWDYYWYHLLWDTEIKLKSDIAKEIAKELIHVYSCYNNSHFNILVSTEACKCLVDWINWEKDIDTRKLWITCNVWQPVTAHLRSNFVNDKWITMTITWFNYLISSVHYSYFEEAFDMEVMIDLVFKLGLIDIKWVKNPYIVMINILKLYPKWMKNMLRNKDKLFEFTFNNIGLENCSNVNEEKLVVHITMLQFLEWYCRKNINLYWTKEVVERVDRIVNEASSEWFSYLQNMWNGDELVNAGERVMEGVGKYFEVFLGFVHEWLKYNEDFLGWYNIEGNETQFRLVIDYVCDNNGNRRFENIMNKAMEIRELFWQK